MTTPQTPPLALTPKQAAQVLNLPENVFAERVAPRLGWIDVDGHRIIPISRLQRWLEQEQQQRHSTSLQHKATGR